MKIFLTNRSRLDANILSWKKKFHSHSFWQLDCYQDFKGKFKLLTESGDFILSDGDMVLLPPFKAHTFKYFEPCDCWSIKFKIEVDRFENIPPRVFNKSCYPFIINEIQEHLSSNKVLDEDILKHALFLLLCHLTQDLKLKVTPPSPPYDPRIRKGLDKIVNGLLRNLNLDELVKNINMSKSHFIKLFHREMGMPPMRYVSELKIKRAKELLSYSHLTISEVSEQLNYPDIHTFSRAFKRYTDHSPSSYRKKVESHPITPV